MAHLVLWCSGAGQVLADNVLLLRSLETLSICDVNPIPVFQALSQNTEHSVSRIGISLWEQPDLVRCLSMGSVVLHTLSSSPTHSVETACTIVHACARARVCVCACPAVSYVCHILCHTVKGVRIAVVLCGPSTLVKCILVTANCTSLLS